MHEQHKNLTNNVGDGKAIRKPAGGTMTREVDAVRRRVSPSSSGQVVVVAIVDEGITEDEESPRLGFGSSSSS